MHLNIHQYEFPETTTKLLALLAMGMYNPHPYPPRKPSSSLSSPEALIILILPGSPHHPYPPRKPSSSYLTFCFSIFSRSGASEPRQAASQPDRRPCFARKCHSDGNAAEGRNPTDTACRRCSGLIL